MLVTLTIMFVIVLISREKRRTRRPAGVVFIRRERLTTGGDVDGLLAAVLSAAILEDLLPLEDAKVGIVSSPTRLCDSGVVENSSRSL